MLKKSFITLEYCHDYVTTFYYNNYYYYYYSNYSFYH